MFRYANKIISNGLLVNNSLNRQAFLRYASNSTKSRSEKKQDKITQYNALFKTKWANTKIRPQESLEHYEKLLLQPNPTISTNPFDHFFLRSGWIPTLSYIPLKLISFFKSIKPLNKSKLNQIMKDNFIKLMAAIQNNDIETMSGLKFDQSHFMLETSRDLFYTFKELKGGDTSLQESSYISVEPIILKLEPLLPNFDTLVAYYITMLTPQPDGTKKKVKYIACILWRGTFPELAPGEKPDETIAVKEKIDFESKLSWKVGKMFVPVELKDVQSERSTKRLLNSIEKDKLKNKNK